MAKQIRKDQPLGSTNQLHRNLHFLLVTKREVPHFSASIGVKVKKLEKGARLGSRDRGRKALPHCSVVETQNWGEGGEEKASSLLKEESSSILNEWMHNVLGFLRRRATVCGEGMNRERRIPLKE